MLALARLSFWKTRNSLRTVLTDPRKLIAAVVVLAYAGLVFWLGGMGRAMSHRPSSHSNSVSLDWVEAIAFLAFVLVAFGVIDSGLGDQLLALPPSDVDYVFPSPISRRAVLAFRLPVLTIGASTLAFGLIFAARVAMPALQPVVAHPGHVHSSGWTLFAAAVLCVGTYMNIAMAISIHCRQRVLVHRVLMTILSALAAGLALVSWWQGLPALRAAADSPWLRVPFLPSSLASQVLTERMASRPVIGLIAALLGVYGLSLIPVFAVDANFYEQSIASSEKVWKFRQAAKGGWSAIAAARAANHRHTSTREYTIPPFGLGATALFWAHLCAAAKRPFASFIFPVLGGGVIGILGGILSRSAESLAIAVTGGALLLFYTSFGFIASARTACEASIRRRELTATVPIPGWQSVLADLGVPILSLLLLSLTLVVAWGAAGGAYWPLVAVSVLLLFVIRMSGRMLITYMLVLAHPDFGDRIQQVIGQFFYLLFAAPLLIAEIVLCIPAILLRSLWLGAATLIAFNAVLMIALCFLAGRATERAIASGEPVRFWRLRSRAKGPSKRLGERPQ